MEQCIDYDRGLRKLVLTERQRLDLEQLLSGGFAPLTGFLDETEYRSVVDSMRLPGGALWSIPIVLDTWREWRPLLKEKIILCDSTGFAIAYFTVTNMYEPDKLSEAQKIYGTTNRVHPGVRYLMEETRDVYLGGSVELVGYTPTRDFKEFRYSPATLKAHFKTNSLDRIVAFQTRNPMHRVHYEIVKRAAREADAHILIHPVVGPTQYGDIDYPTRVRGYKRICERYLRDDATLALLPIAMRMAGPREALWHALIRKNYGATHFIVGRDHAGPRNVSGEPFYKPYEAQELALKHQGELNITIMPIPEMVYVPEKKSYIPVTELQKHDVIENISGTKLRAMLRAGHEIPEWFAFREVVEELRKREPREKLRAEVGILPDSNPEVRVVRA